MLLGLCVNWNCMHSSFKSLNSFKKFLTICSVRFFLLPALICLCSFVCNQIPISAVVSFVEALEVGYSKHKNPYHNLMHAADVTQTVHYLLLNTGMVVSRTTLYTGMLDAYWSHLNRCSFGSQEESWVHIIISSTWLSEHLCQLPYGGLIVASLLVIAHFLFILSLQMCPRLSQDRFENINPLHSRLSVKMGHLFRAIVSTFEVKCFFGLLAETSFHFYPSTVHLFSFPLVTYISLLPLWRYLRAFLMLHSLQKIKKKLLVSQQPEFKVPNQPTVANQLATPASSVYISSP